MASYGGMGGYGPPPPRRHSIVGPLILVAIGVLFLLRNFGYSIPLFHDFVRYWPLLLVAIGLIRLAEYFAARNEQRPVPHMGGGTILLLLLVIVIGMGLSGVFHKHDELQWGMGDHGNDEWMHWFGHEYDYDGELTQALAPGGTVRVICEHGNITVNSWDQPQVKLMYRKRVFAGSRREADAANGKTMPSLQVQGATANVEGNTEAGRGVASDLELYVPAKANLDMTAGHGDVAVSQRTGDVKLDAQRGDVTLDQVTGNASITANKGSLEVSNLTGNLSVDGRLEDLTLDGIQGTVLVSADIFGDTRLSKLNQGATIRTSRTSLQVARLEGSLTMDSGDLQGQGVQGPFSLSTKAKDVNLSNLTGDIHIEDDTGDIDLESASAAALGNLDLTTHHGDVHLRLPAKGNFQCQAMTRHGDISSDFETVRADNHTGGSTASGTVGKGGVQIRVTSDTGDIELSKVEGSTASPPPQPEAPAKPGQPGHSGKKIDDVDVM